MKRLILTAAVAVATAAVLPAARIEGIVPIAKTDGDRLPQASVSEVSNLGMYIWTNKYTYQPGEQLTLRITVRNQNTAAYTVVAFRQNNQTGKRTFFGGGRTSDTAIDIYGNAPGSFAPVQFGDQTKAVVIGPGGWLLDSPLTVPNELGMHTFVVQLRDAADRDVFVDDANLQIGVLENHAAGGVLTGAVNWVNTKAYRITTLTRIENGVLNIQPGTFVLGGPRVDDPTALIITPSARINAQGTRSRPIIMTSDQPFGQRSRQDWGGLVLLGRARVNVTGGAAFIEGLDNRPFLQYGGDDDTHDCGALAYVRVEYGGSVFTQNNEINSFTWGGCGSRTVAHHLHAHYGQDDTFEWFGGNSDLKYAVGSYSADDYIDWQLGWRGRAQYIVGVQHPGVGLGNRGVEGDNSEFGATDQPVSDPKVWNVTLVGPAVAAQDEATGDASPGIYVRRGSRGSLNNFIITNFGYPAVNVRDAQTQSELAAGRLSLNGMLMWNNNRLQPNLPNTVAAQVVQNPAGAAAAAYAADPANKFFAADPMMRRAFEYSDPDYRPMPGSLATSPIWNSPPDDGFFDQWADFCGAFGAEEDWMEEWTSFLRDEDIRL